MSAQHTPGPWMVEPINGGEFFHITTAEDEDFIVIAETPFASAEADANLLAAAPDLLAFVAAFARRDPVFAQGRDKRWIAEARALVAKATGGAA